MQRTCWAGSPDSQLAFWLMIVSTATVVFPVCRSPMMSSRWPRPMGIIESMALIPVCSGSSTALPSLGDDLAQAVDGYTERVDHPAQEVVTDRDGEDLAGALDLLAFLDTGEVTQNDDTNLVGLKVERDTQGDRKSTR